MIKLKTEHLPKAKRYTDYRDMLEHQKDIDAVLVATPAPYARSGCLGGDGAWQACVRPETASWSVEELASFLRRAIRNQSCHADGQSVTPSNDGRTAVDTCGAAAIGDVREVHIWTNRPLATGLKACRRPER